MGKTIKEEHHGIMKGRIISWNAKENIIGVKLAFVPSELRLDGDVNITDS